MWARVLRAVELLGSKCIVTGIKASVAQTMVSLGVDTSRVTTMATLEDALHACLRGMSCTVSKSR